MASIEPAHCCNFIEFKSEKNRFQCRRRWVLDAEFLSEEEIQEKTEALIASFEKESISKYTVFIPEKDNEKGSFIENGIVIVEAKTKTAFCETQETEWLSIGTNMLRMYFNPDDAPIINDDNAFLADKIIQVIDNWRRTDCTQVMTLQCFMRNPEDHSYVCGTFGLHIMLCDLVDVAACEVWLECCFCESFLTDHAILRLGLKMSPLTDEFVGFVTEEDLYNRLTDKEDSYVPEEVGTIYSFVLEGKEKINIYEVSQQLDNLAI